MILPDGSSTGAPPNRLGFLLFSHESVTFFPMALSLVFSFLDKFEFFFGTEAGAVGLGMMQELMTIKKIPELILEY